MNNTIYKKKRFSFARSDLAKLVKASRRDLGALGALKTGK